MSTSMGDILSGNTPAPEPTQAAAAEPAQQATEPAQVETSEPAETGDKVSAEPAQASDDASADAGDDLDSEYDGKPVPLKALKSERQKRQEAQRLSDKQAAEIEFYKSQLQALQQNPAAQQRPTETKQAEQSRDELEAEFWKDPIAFQEKRDQAVRQEMSRAFINQRISESRTRAKSTHQDYDDAAAAFDEAARENPALMQQFVEHIDPCSFAYTAGKQLLQIREHGGDLGKMREAIKAELRAELESEYRTKGAIAAAENVSTSNVGAGRSSGNTNSPVFTGPTPMSAILGAGR